MPVTVIMNSASPQTSRSGSAIEINWGGSSTPRQRQAQPTQQRSQAPARPRGQHLDERSTKLMDFLVDIVERSITDESLDAEKADIKRRISEAENRALQGMLMSFAGDTQSSATLLQQTGEEISKLKYILGMIESDPEGYKQAKVTRAFAEAAPGMQGAASVATAMYLPEAYDTQRYGYNVQASMARSGGGYAPSSGVDDRALIDALGMILDNTSGKKNKQAILDYLIQKFMPTYGGIQ